MLSPEPVSPTFIVVFSALACWLWLCESFNRKIQKKVGASLLEVVAQDGSSWVVERILAQGYPDTHGNVSDDGLVDFNKV